MLSDVEFLSENTIKILLKPLSTKEIIHIKTSKGGLVDSQFHLYCIEIGTYG